MTVRVSLTERVRIESGGAVVDEPRFPGRQGRLVFAYLLAAQGRPVPRDELAEALWGDDPPATWEKALSVLVSKLRALLTECGLDGSAHLTTAFGCYQLSLPAETWIDVVAAEQAASAAEHALAAGELSRHAPMHRRPRPSRGARSSRRGRPLGRGRACRLRETLVRALDCLAEVNRRRATRRLRSAPPTS